MPDPRPDEKKNDYVQRCMGDEESVKDFPGSAQRYAFCQSKWEDSLKESAVTAAGASRSGLIAEDVARKKGRKYMSLAELKRILPMIMSEGGNE